jgi:hypothetical protein
MPDKLVAVQSRLGREFAEPLPAQRNFVASSELVLYQTYLFSNLAMRRTLLLVLLLLFGFGATKSSAVVDSMYANAQTAISVLNPEYAIGAPDGQQAQITSTGELWLRFNHGTTPTDFAPNSTIHIYWSKQSADSVAAVVSLLHVTENWIESKHDSIMIIDQPGMITITVPKSGYNAIHFRLTGNPPATDGSTSFYVDAATLIQDNLGVESTKAQSLRFALYPNPSLLQSGVSLRVPEEYVGHSQIAVYSLTGSEVVRSDVSDITSQIQVQSRGVYVARLIVEGIPVGEAFKFSVE